MPPYSLTPDEKQTYLRYAGLALPRHTSYPTAPCWRDDYGPASFRKNLADTREARRPLSLYVHIPFCERLCYFCACTKEIVPPEKHARQDPGEALIAGLELEAGRLAADLGNGEVRQVHLGGGSPTFLRPQQLVSLWQILKRHFTIAREAEIAAEIDPRITRREHLETLRDLGFNRVSLGVQDFAPRVQEAVNRIQPFSMVEEFVALCRSIGFHSINFDLIYGLPFQTLESMADTIEKTIALSPDRIAFYRLAVIPEIFRWQNVFGRADMPSGDLPLELNLLAIERFRSAGYEFIGLDHFAKPDEELSRAFKDGTLRRNFQGMTTGQGLDVVGMGPSAISQLDSAFAQNAKDSSDWRQRVEHDLATERGLSLSPDDRIRRDLMQQLYGYGVIDPHRLERDHGIVFSDYFAAERDRLSELIEQGLVQGEPGLYRLTNPLGRLLVRVVAAVFDRYLPPQAFREGLPANLSSKVG